MPAITGIIWDQDGTLYMIDDDHMAAGPAAALRALRQLRGKDVAHVTDANILAMSAQSYRDHHTSYSFLTHAYDIPREEARQAFHAHLDAEICIPVRDDLHHAFAPICHLPQCVFTHGTYEWGMRGTERLGLRSIFPPDRVFGLESVGHHKKDESLEGYLHCARAIGLQDLQGIVVVEDAPRNLIIPAAHGAITILVSPQPDAVQKPAHVHHVVPDAQAACRLIQVLCQE